MYIHNIYTVLSLNAQGHCLKHTHMLSANIAAAYSMTYNWYKDNTHTGVYAANSTEEYIHST